jgi:hypothetical protein
MNGRIILQDLLNHLYLGIDNSWVKSCQQARVFKHTYLALLEALHHPDRASQVVWCFQKPDLNFYIAAKSEDTVRIHRCVSCPLLGRTVAGPRIA